MAVTGVPRLPTSPSTGNQSSSGNTLGNTNLSESDFLTLLVQQLQNQDPLNPISNAEFATQLAQFSTVEGITQLNQNISNLLVLQDLGEGANLIGKTVSYVPNGSSTPKQGTVSGVQINNGQIQLTVGADTMSLSQLRGVLVPGG